jgi:glycosyltransferase involved in cell wall biosynthesis
VAAIPTPIRIARIVTRFGVGGVERHVSTLTANLNHERFRSWLICGRAEKNERECPEFARDAGVEPVFIESLRRNLGVWDLNASYKLHHLLKQIKPQIVETHQSKAGALGRSMARLNFGSNGQRPRLIHTFHGHQFTGYYKSSVARAFILIERWLARLTDMIVTVTPTIRRQLINEYQIVDASRVRVVPLGFDFSWLNDICRERGWLRARLGVNSSTVIFGAVGRFAPIKNTELLLRSFARMLREHGVDARLVLVGDGEMRNRLESLARDLSISDQVLFAGWVLDRAKIFCDLDVTCLSSHNEGSPLCLIESIAAGVPVIATNVGGVADVASSELDGELIESANEQAYAAALARAARSRRRVPTQRSAALRDFYSIRRLMGDMESIYSELLDGSAVH